MKLPAALVACMMGIPTTELVLRLCHKETVKVEVGLKVKLGVLRIKY